VQGILLIDKPIGWTSFDVVNYVRREAASLEGVKPKNIKVGHTGTLDPFASGLLIVLIGKDYTRKASSFSKLDKTYEVTARLGSTSSTGDPEGVINETSSLVPSLEDIQKAVVQLTGEISQVPPAFSAIKINGQRAYRLARAGKPVVIEPRIVTVHRFNVELYDYPEVHMITNVSSGTYIRSLVESVGDILGSGAYTAALRRVKIGDFTIHKAHDIKTISASTLSQFLQQVV
jgi:tRNA pseudouridine55 synthase